MKYHDAVILVPCHNEELAISETILEIKTHLEGITIIVIDNASTDDTYGKALEHGVIVLRAPKKGKGFAIRRGIEELELFDFKLVFMIDGDATYSVKEFIEAYSLITDFGFDMIVGNRIPEKLLKQERKAPYRKLHSAGNRVLTFVNRIFFGLEIHDTLSGWRAFSPGFIASFPGGASQFEIEVELNSHAFVLKSSIANLDVGYRGRHYGSESKLRTYKDGFRILKRLTQLFRNERPLIAYTFLAAPWLCISAFLVLRALSTYLVTKDVPNFPSLIAGVAAFIVSALLWTTGMIVENVRISRSQQLYFRSRRKYI